MGILTVLVLTLGLAGACEGQVVFDDEPNPTPTQQRSPQSLTSFQQQSTQQGGFGFGGNQNQVFGNGQSFSSASASSGGGAGFGGGFSGQRGQGFGGGQNGNGFNGGGQNGNGFNGGNGFGGGQNGNGFGGGGFGGGNGFAGQNGQPAQFQQDPANTPDCQTFDSEGGICTPLTSCERIGRLLRNRAPLAAARLLRRSICGFNGVFPIVCCPLGRGGGDNSLGNGNENNFNPQTQPPQTFPIPTQPPRPPPTFPTTTQRPNPPPTFATQRPPPITTQRIPFGGGVGVTLIPPKTTTVGGGGGLIVIGPTPEPTPTPTEGTSSSPGLSDVGLPTECGYSNASHTRIVGGHPASKGAWPWIAALGYRDDTGNVNYLCGATLISKDFVVTASHCVFKRNDLVTVRLGDHDLFSDGDGVVPLNLEVAEIIQHPKYDSGTFYNDIALIRLKQSVPFTRQVHPICLPSTPQLRTNKFEDNTPFVAGWGAIQFNGPSSSVLKEVQLPIVPDSVCQDKFKSFKSVNVDDTNICAGLAAGGKDACQGDSGGPLMQPVGNNKYVLIGIVSFGFKCAEPGYPGVYSRITTHLPWIEKTINT